MPYDFTDDAVYGLVKRTHMPMEEATIQVTNADGQVAVPSRLELLCEMDRQPWPCDAVVQLRAFELQKAREYELQRQASKGKGNQQQQELSGAEIYRRRITEGKISG